MFFSGFACRFSRAQICCLFAAVAGFTFAIAPAQAQDSAQPQIESVAIGFGGDDAPANYKLGYWTPIRITLTGGNQPFTGQLDLIAPDGDGLRAAYTDQQKIQLSAGGRQSVMRYAMFGRLGADLTVVLKGAGGETAARRSFRAATLAAAQPATFEVVLTVGTSVGVADGLRSVNRRRPDEVARIATLLPVPGVLPDRWYGYDGVDIVVLPTSDQSSVERLSDEQIDALDQWVKLGGRLVICAGKNGPQLLGSGAPLERFAPGRVVEVIAERRTSGLEEYAGAVEPIAATEDGGPLRVSMTVLADVQARVEAYESVSRQRPVVTRAAYGLGQVVVVAVDLDAPPFATWSGRPQFVDRLLEDTQREGPGAAGSSARSQTTSSGFRDMTGQLRLGLDQFEGVTLVAFSWIGVLIAVYILIIGPADYFFLRKIVGNMAWTWISFPLVVAGCCLLAFYLNGLTKGDQLHINQVDVVDIDVDSQIERGSSWSHLYTPQTAQFNLSLDVPQRPAGETAAGQLLSWHGLPGEALGGMNTSSAANLFNQPYQVSSSPELPASQAALSELPIQVGASKTLAARWWRPFTRPRLDALQIEPRSGSLAGTFGNSLAVDLTDCVLFYGRWAYVMERGLASGETVSIGELPDPRTLDWHLTRRSVEGSSAASKDEPSGDTFERWNPVSDDVQRIIEIMMFYEAAGGSEYTGLVHRYQRFLDLSEHLGLRRAVLLGRAEQPACELTRDGQPLRAGYDHRWTYYRLVLPVGDPPSPSPKAQP